MMKMEGSMSLKQARCGGFVVIPVYDKDEMGNDIELDIPDQDRFMAVGYDRKPGDGIMHYRYRVNKELEDTAYIDTCPFDKFHCF
jgi:hypothetical protein